MQFDALALKIEFLEKDVREINTLWKGRSYNENFARLYYIIAGEAEISHHGEIFILKPKTMYLVPPQSNMRYLCPNSVEVAWVHFNITLLDNIDLFKAYSCSYCYHPEEVNATQAMMLELLSLIDQHDLYSQLTARSHILRLISYFFQYHPPIESFSEREKFQRMAPVLKFIENNLAKGIKLSDLATLATYERTYFSTVFKSLFSVSPKRYVQNKRIEKAQHLLRNKNLKLSTISEQLGFNDAFHFSKTFKKITGENPSDFRNRIPHVIP